MRFNGAEKARSSLSGPVPPNACCGAVRDALGRAGDGNPRPDQPAARPDRHGPPAPAAPAVKGGAAAEGNP
jgi:hypothetical protein